MDIRVDGKWPVRLEVALGVQPGLPVGDWIWTDITDACFKGSQPAPIQITYGRQDEMSDTQPAAMTTTLDNQDGRFTPGNVTSPLWPWWRRGLPIRARLDGLNLTGMEVSEVPNAANSWAETPDHSSFAVTDLDVRIDITPQSWRPSHGLREVLAGQYGTTGNQRAWYLAITNGVPELLWSANGAAPATVVAAGADVPADSGRLTVRATLDVDNGSGGFVVRFFTGPSVDGPWTQLGSPINGTPTTGIFNSAVPLEVGSANGGGGVVAPQRAFTGTIYRFRLCAGIDGAPVADPHFAAINPGADTFTDSAGRPWTLKLNARITDPAIRYCGQLAEIAPTWPYGDVEDHTNGDGESQVAITAAGLLRRIGQGAAPLRSSLYRGLTSDELPHPVAYWPSEDGKTATELVEAFGRPPLRYFGDVDLAAKDTAASAPIPTYKTGYAVGEVAPAPNTGYLRLVFLSLWPDSIGQDSRLMQMWMSGGTIGRWEILTKPNSNLFISAWNHAGGLIFATNPIGFDILGRTGAIWLELTQQGGNISWGLSFAATPNDQEGGFGQVLNGHTNGVARQIVVAGGGDLNSMGIGHEVIYNVKPDQDLLSSLRAWNNERAATRIRRINGEHGIRVWQSVGWIATERVGPQRIDTLPTLTTEAVQADLGIQTETLDTLGLHYRARVDLYDQDPVLVLDAGAAWGHIVNPFSPVDDDQAIRNDVEASRPDGSSVRVTDDDHIAEHGRYDEQVTVNVATDGQLPDIAGWRLHLGTWPGMRYPELSPALDAHPELATTWLRMRPGDLVRVTGLPRQHPPGPVELLVQGWSESISPQFWTATANTTAAGPWDTGHASDAVDPDPERADTAGSLTATAAAPGGHVLYAATTQGPLWTDAPAEMPLPLRVDGEDVQIDTVDRSLWDFFSGRTVSNGWGTSTNGVPWTVAGGAVADYSVDSGFGRMSLTDRGINRFALSTLAVDQTHVSLQIVAHIGVNPTGGNILVCGNIRMADFNNFIMCRIIFMPNSMAMLDVVRRFNGVETLIAATPQLSISIGADVGARIEAHGTALRARIWEFDPSGDEPPFWMITGTDPTPKQGQVAVWSRTETNNTNTLPVTTSWFQVALDNPQKLTLPAAGPGFQRAHPVGRDIRLTRPSYVAW